jgi:hypothetical protein
MIFSILIIHDHDRISSITRFPHITTGVYFTYELPDFFSCSPKAVKESIMTDVNMLVQEFWTSSDGAFEVEASFFAMRRLLKILKRCFDSLKVCLDFFFFRLPST